VLRLALDLRDAGGQLLAENHLELSIQPSRLAPHPSPILYTPDEMLSARLVALGYTLTSDLKEADAAVTGQPDPSLLAYLHGGGRLLVLADRAGSDGPLLPGVQRAARKDTPWYGDWASSFSWLVRRGPFARIPGQPLIDHSFDRVIPQHVLTGFWDWDFPSLVHSGIVVGWIHRPAVLIGERFYGKGRAVLNTFRLEDEALGRDPTATALLDGLIELTLYK
jgi:hypothetical protein